MAAGEQDQLPWLDAQGMPGRWLTDRPLRAGFVVAIGVLLAVALVRAAVRAEGVLELVLTSLVLAMGLDAMVIRLERRGLSRGLAVSVVLGIALLTVVGFVAAVVPPLTTQASRFAARGPQLPDQLQHSDGQLGRLVGGLHLGDRLKSAVSPTGLVHVAQGVVAGGRIVFSVLAGAVTIVALTVYLVIDLPRVRRFSLALVPRRRRPRVSLLADAAVERVGGFVVGNLLTSVVAGVGTLVWLLAFGVPYPLLLAVVVAVLDLIPVVGSTVGGIAVSLVALSVSLPVAIATAGFYTFYRLAEDYLLVPRVMKRTVDVRPLTTVLSTLIGGTLAGIPGALLAIPVAATIQLVGREVVLPAVEQR